MKSRLTEKSRAKVYAVKLIPAYDLRLLPRRLAAMMSWLSDRLESASRLCTHREMYAAMRD